MTIPAARYDADYIPGSLQFGLSKAGNEQISVDLKLENGMVVTAFLSFSEAAKPYSEERLRALGWGGAGSALDDTTLTQRVKVDISYRLWEGKEQMDVNIVTGGGRVKMKSEMDAAQKSAFLRRLCGDVNSGKKPALDF